MSRQDTEFSIGWMIASLIVFIAAELLIGGLVGDFVVGRYKSWGLAFMLQGLLNLLSYFVGGFIIGLVSPGIRVLEPALGAFLALALTFTMTFFMPFAFLRFSLTKLLIGGAIAFALALTGAKLGERVAGNRVD